MQAAGVERPPVQALLMEVQIKGPLEVTSSPPCVKALGYDNQCLLNNVGTLPGGKRRCDYCDGCCARGHSDSEF